MLLSLEKLGLPPTSVSAAVARLVFRKDNKLLNRGGSINYGSLSCKTLFDFPNHETFSTYLLSSFEGGENGSPLLD